MPTFAELIESLRNPVEGQELSPTIYDELTAAYTEDVSIRDAAVLERDARLTEAQNAIAEREKEVLLFKGKNYDLLMAMPGNVPDTQTPDTETPSGIASLFEPKEK